MRYAESRLIKISHLQLEEIDKETVNVTLNCNGSKRELMALPVIFLNLSKIITVGKLLLLK